MKNEKCENCKYWQSWETRIEAVISDARSNKARNIIDLRKCSFVPHPTQIDFTQIYTDKDYFCSEFVINNA